MFEKEISVNFQGKKFIIKFPNVGQMMDIEAMKLALTNNKYGTFVTSGIKSMYFVLDMVDTISFLSIMCPKLKNFITTEDNIDYTQMNIESVKPIVDLYKKDILPWYNKTLNELYKSANDTIIESESNTGNK